MRQEAGPEGGEVIESTGGRGSIRYEFRDDGMICTVRNTARRGSAVYLVFDPQVEAVMGGEGQLKRTIVNEKWQTTHWFKGEARLTISGGDEQWGPWARLHQVWQANVGPGEVRRIEFSFAKATPEELARLQALRPPPGPGEPVPQHGLVILSPREYQVFQRARESSGTAVVSGWAMPGVTSVEARVIGTSRFGQVPGEWREAPLAQSTRSFGLQWPMPAGGWYRLEMRAFQGGQALPPAAVGKFGVGEVFLGAGQSNSTNWAEVRTEPASGMVSSFDGSCWRPAYDPQPGPHDASLRGSFWPSFGDAMYQRYGVPIGVATTGHGGTNVDQWQPDEELHNWMMTRIYELGPYGFRALLWHQGEADADTPSDEYYEKLKRTILASKVAAGWDFPWFVARASYHNPDHPSWPGPRAGQQRIWEEGLALPGPDTDTLGGEYRDLGGKGAHFNAKGLKVHGELWAERVGAYLDQVLGR
jgi:hypothetical protein